MKKLSGVFAAVTAAVSIISAPAASAAEGNLVNFGDSIAADSPTFAYIGNRIERTFQYGSSIPGKNCIQSPTNYGHQTAQRLGLAIADYSCPGATSVANGPKFFDQVDQALADGTLNAGTRRVLITQGFNDAYNLKGWDQGHIRGAYVDAMRPQIDRIRAAAPNARIQIVGYLPITDNGRACLFHVLPSGPVFAEWRKLPFGSVSYWEDTAQWMNVDLANATGTEFVDLKVRAANHGMCAPDHERWFAGIIDFTAGGGNMPLHVNSAGHAGIANILARS
ncbi:SGNH/GDSL hydrolase family protein [Corynebacterium diphtheriae]|nr:SGNH/GDSL hydrolase family protein [Corynebacterium diphtheriae]